MSSVQKIAKPRANLAFQALMSVHWWMAGFYFVEGSKGFMAQVCQGNENSF